MIFFFFNDPAPTEIYPLSLPDALPIWVDLVFADPPFNIGYLYHGYNDQRNPADYLNFSREWVAAVHRALKPAGRSSGDRKSTRLNSSHANISYAVFCLKKKTLDASFER